MVRFSCAACVKVLETIEREIIAKTAKNFTEREKSLQNQSNSQ
jgi:hypothetical protein